MRSLILLTLTFITACTPLVPATTPPQLQHTPGAFVSIDDEYFDAGMFRLNYPDGWRTVKLSVASAPLEVVFASPDDTMVIHVSEVPLPEREAPPNTYTRSSVVIQDDITIYMQGEAPLDQRSVFDEIFAQVLESIAVAASD